MISSNHFGPLTCRLSACCGNVTSQTKQIAWLQLITRGWHALLKTQCIQSSTTFGLTLWPLSVKKQTIYGSTLSPSLIRYEPVSPLLFRAGNPNWCCNELMFVMLQAASDETWCCHPWYWITIWAFDQTVPRLIKEKFSNYFNAISGVKCPHPGFVSSFFYGY